MLTLHKVKTNTPDDGNNVSIKTVICFWKTSTPQTPLKVILSEGVVNKNCSCVLKDAVVVCGTKDGMIQLWDVRESLRLSLKDILVKNKKEYCLEDDVTNMSLERCELISLVRVSDDVAASLDRNGKVELW